MPSELEKLVAELRAIAVEAERLRPRLARHAGVVRQFAAEIGADPDGRSTPSGHAVSLLHQASLQCDALAAELANAKRAADHFAARVVGGGGPDASSAPPAPSRTAPADGPAADLAPSAEVAPTAASVDKAAPPVAPPPGAATPPGSGVDAEPRLPPYVPWWIPNGAPWHGHRGIAPRTGPDGKPLTRFSPDDLAWPEAAGAEARGGHGGPDVPLARVPIADTSRDLVTAFVEAGYTSPNCLPKGLVEERCFWMDQCGHAALRHAEIPHSALIDRIMLGHDPIGGNTSDWESGEKHQYSRNATTFTSRAAAVFAEAKIWESPKARQSLASAGPVNKVVTVRMRAVDVFGADFRRHITGWRASGSKKAPTGVHPIVFSEDTTIVVGYRRYGKEWFPYTMYPDPK